MTSEGKSAQHFSAEHAALYDNEFSFALGKAIANHFLSLSGGLTLDQWKHARVLDFACGTGIISQVSISDIDIYISVQLSL